MRLFCFISFFLFPASVIGQAFSFPAIGATAESIQKVIPFGWILFDSIAGDLDGDKINDQVAILEYGKTVLETRPNGDTITTKPRILLVFIKRNRMFKLKLQHNTFLFRNGEDMIGEIYPQLAIRKGLFVIHYDLWHDYATYRFRYQNNDFYLIGATVSGVHGSVWSEDDVNLSTKYLYRTSFIVGEERSKKTERIYLKTLKPLKFRNFKMPLTYQLAENYVL